jgi:glucose-6-phosphate 1-dehydrogenase
LARKSAPRIGWRSSYRPRRACSRPTIRGLESAGLAQGARIGLEKPLGTDLASSREINDAVASAFPESRIFRIDHYLGKETVQNLLALRFANIMFEPLWNAQHIEHVQITVAETVGLEKRADFYDQTGALRDMVQNHMLQLLALVAMEPPSDFEAGAVRDEKVKVLRALRPVGPGESVTGQYRAGAVQGAAGPGLRRRARPRQRLPRRSSRSRRTSTTGAGRACRSTCAPASGCPSG